VTEPTGHRHAKPTWRAARRAVAPIPLGPQLLIVWALLLAGGALAAVADLRWWLGVALLIPGLVLQVRAGRRAAEEQGVRERVFSIAENVVPGIFGAGLAVVAATVDRRYFALILVAGVIILVDPAMRWQWNRRYGTKR
jgi:hypothetical protein